MIDNINTQIQQDRKTQALKQLQGHMWRHGYEKGELKGEIYDDVHEMMKQWYDAGYSLQIYSSGSVEAQQVISRNHHNIRSIPHRFSCNIIANSHVDDYLFVYMLL